MATLTYYVADIINGLIIGDAPFYGVTLEWTLSGAGTFSGRLQLHDPEVQAKGGGSLVQEGRTALFVDYDGVLLWAGIMWISDYDSDTGELTVTGADYWSYLQRRVVTDNISYPAGTPVKTIINKLLSYALSPYAPAGLSVVFQGSAASTQTAAFTYAASDRKNVAELLEGLAAASPGFDFRAEGYWAAPDRPRVNYVFGIPSLERSVTTTNAYFDYPGNIIKYTETDDGSSLASRVWVRGASDGTNAPEYPFEDAAMYFRYPRYDRAESIDESSPANLQAKGRYIHYARKRVTKKPSVIVRPDGEVSVTQYKVGDDGYLSIHDDRHPDGDEYIYRIATITLDVEQQQVTLTHWSDPSLGASN